jgi:glyoxylase-like metal-dependent hydrolase (beta-lactamase superfamily II)
MAEVKILIEGYAKEEGNALFASPTTTLIIDSGLNILVDPGANEKKLLESLKKEGLEPKDIDILFLSHYHLDHTLNIKLFPGKDIYDGSVIYSDDKETEYSGSIPNTKVKIIQTPGHADEHCSLLVETKKGKIVVAADVFWWRDDEEQRTDTENLLNHKDDYANDEEELIKSRKKLLEIADYIIPGHGKMFKVKK